MRAPLALAVLVPLLAMSVSAGEPATLPLPFWLESTWSFEGSGRHQGWEDRRDLFVLYHPWESSESGGSGTVWQEVRIPQDWQGRIRLHFYMSDNYHGQHPNLAEDSWLGQMSLVNHRFKQVLLDDEVIWEKDVADPEGVSEPTRFSVLLPERVRPGDEVRLGFRLLDRVGSAERQPGDFRHIGDTEEIGEEDPWRFMTHVYIGDVVLAPEEAGPIEEGELPSAARVRQAHQARWPLEPYGEPVDFPVALRWEGSEDAPAWGSPIRCGIPLPAGRVREVSRMVLRGQTGRSLPLQLRPMNFWADGSVRWVELDAIAMLEDAGPGGELMLDIDAEGAEVAAPEDPVSVVLQGERVFRITTGRLEVVVGGGGGVLVGRMAQGEAVLRDLVGQVQIEGQIYQSVVDSFRVLAAGPVRGEVELSGELRANDEVLGRFVFRLAAMAGQPYVRMTWRIFNDRPAAARISRFELVGEFAPGEEAICRWGSAAKMRGGTVRLQQLSEELFEVVDGEGDRQESGESAAGWLGAAGPQQSLLVLVRHFRQQFPKALEFRQGKLRIALFEATAEQPHYLPSEGEAKRHEIWLGLWDRDLSAEEMGLAARAFSRPARLFDAGYFSASGGFGYAAIHDEEHFADLDAYMKRAYGDIEEHRFYELGMRNWGDWPYGRDENTWCNGYYDRQQGLASEYLMSGDSRWFDRLEATVRHIMDIDVCHASAAHPEQVGAMYSCYSVNHNGGGIWVMMQRIKGMLAYWRLSGDLDARQTALGVADCVIRNEYGMGRSSVRDHGGALYCLMAAYDETGESRYLDAAGDVARDALGRIDSRRGCYAEVHGNISYRGNVPWMVAQLAQPLYEYYRESGEVDAAIGVVGLAESILAENCTRGVPGDVFGYSHNPHYKKNSGYHILIAPAVLYAGELTGDEFFLEQGRAMYAQTIRENTVNSINNCYWNTPTLLYYLKRFGRGEEAK